jgi:hypothetical protein
MRIVKGFAGRAQKYQIWRKNESKKDTRKSEYLFIGDGLSILLLQ